MQPVHKAEHKGRKFLDFQKLIRDGRNIASTHTMFSMIDEETLSLLREQEYTLIMDEVYDVIRRITISPSDVDILLKSGYARMDGGRIVWEAADYSGTMYRELFDLCKYQEVFVGDSTKGVAHYWLFQKRVFEAFKSIYVLTYMFDVYPLRAYMDANNMPYEFIGTHKVGDYYEFCPAPGEMPEYVSTLRDHIHILEHRKMNEVGEARNAFSYQWCGVHNAERDDRVRRNLINYFLHISGSRAKDRLWTYSNEDKKAVCGDGYTKSFIVANERATNRYADRTALAYCINIFLDPRLRRVINDLGQDIDQDRYAISEMVQWIWRSAIRNGQDIQIYIPSRRMRGLLYQWIDDVSAQAAAQAAVREEVGAIA